MRIVSYAVACVAGCESNAITEGETQSHIDVTICIEWGTCKINCPSENDWKDQKDGKYEKQLTLMHAISRSRHTPLALKSVNVPQEKNERFGNSRKDKSYMLSTIDTK